MTFQVTDTVFQPLDGDGNVMPSATLSFYVKGGTSVTQDVYADQALTNSLGSTITADGYGRFTTMYINADYTAVLKNKDGVQQWQRDYEGPLGTDSVATANIQDGAVTAADKIEPLGDAKIIVGSGTAANAVVSVSGDVTITNTGVVTIAAGAVEESMLATAVQTKLNAGTGIIFKLKQGMELSNNGSDAAHDIDVAAGTVVDSANAQTMTLSATTTTAIDASIGTGNGGFPTALTLTADTWYRVFICAEADGTNPKLAFDTSATAANALSEWSTQTGNSYTIYRRIGWVLTDSSSNIVAFNQYGDRFTWDVEVIDHNSGWATGARTSVTISAPVGSLANINLDCYHAVLATTYYGIITSADQTDTVPDVNNNTYYGETGRGRGYHLDIVVGSSNEIYYRGTSAVPQLTIHTLGWIDLWD